MKIQAFFIAIFAVVILIMGREIYKTNFGLQCVFKAKIHYLNGEQETYDIDAPCSDAPKMTDNNRGYGSAYTTFVLGGAVIGNVCRFEVLSVDTIKKAK
jgi:hypothetical protein